MILSKQHTIVRTNCIDCLDRTNVVQTSIARRMLMYQLSLITKEPFVSSTNIKKDFQKLLPAFSDHKLEIMFREMWGDNGDHLSMLYAGNSCILLYAYSPLPLSMYLYKFLYIFLSLCIYVYIHSSLYIYTYIYLLLYLFHSLYIFFPFAF